MDIKYHKSEKGQAIVYLVIGLVVFLGFVALAIDGGMVLADRRDAQNATDASALAGASAAAQQLGTLTIIDPNHINSDCTSSLTDDNNKLVAAKQAAINAAEGRAGSNHYTISTTDAINYVQVQCGVNNGPYMDVSVQISKTTPTSFLQVLVPNANLANKMSSVARLHTARSFGGGNTLVALGTLGNSIVVGGTANLRIMGGGVFGNADTKCDGGSSKEFIMVCDPTFPVSACTGSSAPILPGTVNIVGTDGCKGQIHPAPIEGATALDPAQFEYPAPDCTNHEYGTGHPAFPSSGTLAAGLYCVHGDISLGDLTGTDVTIYLVDGGLTINGNATVTLKSPPVTKTTSLNGAIPGLLFFAPLSNESPIKKNGTAGGDFYGTWLLPGMSMVTPGWKGTFAGSFHGLMVVKNFDMAGTFDGGMWYDTNYIPIIPSSLDLLH